MSEHKFEFKPKDFSEVGIIVKNIEFNPGFGSYDCDCVDTELIAKTANAKIAPLLARLNELEKMIEDARGALEFYTWSCNVLVGVGKDGKKDLFELKQIMPGVVWNTDIPTQESMPVPFGTVARKCLARIEEIK